MALRDRIANYTDSAILNIIKYKINGKENKSNFNSEAESLEDYINDVNNYLDQEVLILLSDPNVIDFIFDADRIGDNKVYQDTWNKVYSVLDNIFPVVDQYNYIYDNPLAVKTQEDYLDFLREAYNIYVEEAEKTIAAQTGLFEPLVNITGEYI